MKKPQLVLFGFGKPINNRDIKQHVDVLPSKSISFYRCEDIYCFSLKAEHRTGKQQLLDC